MTGPRRLADHSLFPSTAFDVVTLASGRWSKRRPQQIDAWAKAAKVKNSKSEKVRTVSTNSIGWFFGRC